MAARNVAPKQEKLKAVETLNSFNAWKDNLLYTLSLTTDFAPFLVDGVTWGLETTANRGFANDGEEVTDAAQRVTAVQKAARLRLMLGQIANYATIISRNQIVGQCTSLKEIWSKIREYYGFQCTGSRFLSLSALKLKPAERPEELYQRLISFFDDNLITTDGLLHHGVHLAADEAVTPTVENTIVLLWLERIHIGLPGLVQQKYGAELRNKSLASLKSEISLALQSLLNELESSEDSRILRAQVSRFNKFPSSSFNNRSQQNRNSSTRKCCLCEAANRSGADTHFLSQCRYLPEGDKKRFAKIRNIEVDSDEEDYDEEVIDTRDCPALIDNPVQSITRRVRTRKSPFLNCMYLHFPARVCLDSGAESNLISYRFAKSTNMVIDPSRQGAVQADERTPLQIIGEVKNIQISCGSHVFTFDALVTKTDVGDIIGGEPFLEDNDVALRPAKKQIIIKGRDIIPYQGEL